MIHQVVEGVQEQTANESIAYGIDVEDYPSAPASVSSVAAYDITEMHSPEDVSDTVLDGTASFSGTVITTPSVENLTAGRRYRVRVVFVADDANTYEVIVDIDCEL